jgi:hypothetical protein
MVRKMNKIQKMVDFFFPGLKSLFLQKNQAKNLAMASYKASRAS